MSAEPQYLYLTTSGWKTGNPHRIEIWFVKFKNKFYLVSERRHSSHWVRNIQHNPTIEFEVGEAHHKGTARALDPAEDPVLAAEISALMLQKYGWSDGLIVELAPQGT